MSITIEEIVSGTSHKYVVNTFGKNKNRIGSYTVWCTLKQVNINNYLYYLLFDKNGSQIKDFYIYVNHILKYKSVTYRRINAYFLKRLYEYSFCIGKELKRFTYQDYLRFQYFITGNNNSLNDISYFTYSDLSSVSIDKLLSIIKKFLEVMNISDPSFIKRIKFKSKSGRGQSDAMCPMFISYAQMLDIKDFVLNDSSISLLQRKEYIAIYDLAYFAGLRIGEILGITIQDIKKGYSQIDETPFYKIIIRNRMSDNLWQHAKTSMNVTEKSDYSSKAYKSTRKTAVQDVLITEKIYREIIDYFDLCFGFFHKKGLEPALADNVEGTNDRNYYVFNNKLTNTPLSYFMICRYTRKVFQGVGIPVDNNVRAHNLLHRFRHGFCMYLLYVKNLPPQQVIIYSRHSSVTCLEPYINPSEEMLRELYLKIWEEDHHD